MKIFYCSFLILLSINSIAQTYVGGTINANTTWTASGNPYIVTEDVTVSENVTLEIKPGVIVKFNKTVYRLNITVYGTLRIIGNEDSLVVFTSNEFIPMIGDWGGIGYFDSAIDYNFGNETGCIIQFCKFSYGSHWDNSTNAMIDAELSSVYIDNNTFLPCSGNYVVYEDAEQTEVRITNNKFLNAHTYPFLETVFVFGADGGQISCNLFYNNTSGQIQTNTCNNLQIHNNIFAGGNSASFYIGISDQFFENILVDENGVKTLFNVKGDLEHNTISRLIPSNSYLGQNNFFTLVDTTASIKNNNFFSPDLINNGQSYFYYNSIIRESFNSSSIDVSNNWYDSFDTNDMSIFIWDYYDDTIYYRINYNPTLTSPDIIAPISPPTGVVKTDLGGGNVKVNWNANPEADVAGYKIYWGNPSGYSFSNFVDVGNVNSYILTNFNFADTVAVTAYDVDADGLKDQCDGNESWFTSDYILTGISEVVSNPYNIRCFPNPANDFVHLTLNSLSDLNGSLIRVTSIDGRFETTYKLPDNHQLNIPVSDIENGIYLVSILQNEKEITATKLVVLH